MYKEGNGELKKVISFENISTEFLSNFNGNFRQVFLPAVCQGLTIYT